MAYTLKSSGLATELAFCVAVDEDGTTIKEFVSSTVNSTMTRDAAVTVSSATWKGTSRGYFETFIGAGSDNFNFQGIRFGANKPAWSAPSNGSHGMSLFFAAAGMGAGGGVRAIVATDSAEMMFIKNGTTAIPEIYGISSTSGTTAYPVGTTKFSGGFAFLANGNCDLFYGLESGALALDKTNTTSGVAFNNGLASIGGYNGQGHCPTKFFIVCGFNRILNTTEYQSLHDDWFGTLFEAPVTYSYVRPASDITTQWTPSTGTAHYDCINEAVASDTDYIVALSAGLTDEITYAQINSVKAATNLKFRYRVQGTAGGAKLTYSVYNGATLVKSDTQRTADGDYELTVTPTELTDAGVSFPWTPRGRWVSQ